MDERIHLADQPRERASVWAIAAELGQLRIEVQDGGPHGYPPPKPLDAPASPVHP